MAGPLSGHMGATGNSHTIEARHGHRRGHARNRRSTGRPEQHLEAGSANIATLKCLVVIEKGDTGYGAYVPDLPGCVAAGASHEVVSLIRDAIEFHIDEVKQDGHRSHTSPI